MSRRILSTLFLLVLAMPVVMAHPQQESKPQDSKPRNISVSGGVLQGSAIKKVSPPYPPIAKAAHATGKVEVQITISEQGDVIEAIVVSGHPLLRDASLAAAKQWVFKPTELNDLPVKMQGILAFNFTLTNDDSDNQEIPPTDAPGFLERGRLRLRLDDLDGALADLGKAIELVPNNPQAYYQRAVAWQSKGEFEATIADCTQAIALSPKDAMPFVTRGMAWLGKGDSEKALADFNAALELNPRLAVAYCMRGMMRTMNGDADSAIADFSKAIEVEPKSDMAWRYRGNTRFSIGDQAGGIDDLTKVIELQPQSARNYVDRGQMLQRQGKEAEARKDFDRALKLDPEVKFLIEGLVKTVR